MKRLLIISPYFPPVNAADMQRVRMSLPYFADLGWEAEVVTVDPKYSDQKTDSLLLQSVDPKIKVYQVKALDKRLTGKLGLGSIALRSLWFYKKKVNRLLKSGRYDLIYFSTTQFPVCILGNYWKKRFGVPYVIDMQDPWHSDYYLDKPKEQRPNKFWFSYRLNKYLEPIAMKGVDGLISVSDSYIDDLKLRYSHLKEIPSATITFGAFEKDLQIARDNKEDFPRLLNPAYINIVYIGRGGMDMHKALNPVFKAIEMMEVKDVKRLKLYFIGTSYAAEGLGKETIMPLARTHGLAENVIEITGRISYYHTLATLQDADALLMPGSDDPKYTASKIFPYILTRKPLLAVFHPQSSAISILKEFGVTASYDYETIQPENIWAFLRQLLDKALPVPSYSARALAKYAAQHMTVKQCELFDEVLNIAKKQCV